ncbi:sigma-70 family RNA polymerase sigma factor [Roseisolibacter agri]|uniref:RNA polymerase sigma factor FliA n=1 Tax=Roseisolibacter agri TaxID=2014610 RepID=A0AA37VEG0_9BACT|nr:sigma-70 family RNA polymerase sigma factor [Roseisolibacter agri]GLC25079.1 hypothetical protein rosag_15920 [Roseisolibacter agri]
MALDAPSSIDPADHLGLLYREAGRLAARIRRPRAELLGDGYLGLVAAAAAFDASRGLRFSTFAAPRIRGAMLDGRRQLAAIVPGSRRPDYVAPSPIDDENAHRFPCRAADALALVVDVDQAARLWAAVDQLPSELAHIVRRYFRDDWTLKEIGLELGVSEARASQLRARALARLRLTPWRFVA